MDELTEALNNIVEEAKSRLRNAIDAGVILTPKQSDLMAEKIAGDIADEYGIEQDSMNYDVIISALFEVAGNELPGDW